MSAMELNVEPHDSHSDEFVLTSGQLVVATVHGGIPDGRGGDAAQENARKLKAYWNAWAGMPALAAEELDAIGGVPGLRDHCLRLSEQKIKLRSALQQLLDSTTNTAALDDEALQRIVNDKEFGSPLRAQAMATLLARQTIKECTP